MNSLGTFRAGVVMSLWDVIKETKAETIVRLSSIVGQLVVLLDLTQPNAGAMAGSLGELQREAEHLGLKPVVRQLDRIKEHFTSSSATTATLKPMVVDLYNRLLEEMEDRVFLTLSPTALPFYVQSEPLFGTEVDQAFSSAADDISETGKCFALGRYTASVFHLMRTLERGITALSRETKAQPGNPNWETVLNAITTRVNQMGPTTDGADWKVTQQFHSECVAQFRIFQHAWRNYVTHSSVTYDEERARAIYESVREFMRHLATRVRE